MKFFTVILPLFCLFAATCEANQEIEQTKKMKYELTPLEYSSSALEPWIDTRTVDLHHYKHHAAYVDKLNAALASAPTFSFGGSLGELLANLDTVPEAIRGAVRNNGGGAWNHTFYWRSLAPANMSGEPSDTLMEAIRRDFGSFEAFKTKMTAAAVSQFGSGWAWLCVDQDGNLKIVSTPNQDSPAMGGCVGMKGLIPILAIDVWEHAYYLKYQNRRQEYAEAIWNIINWKRVSERFDCALKTQSISL